VVPCGPSLIERVSTVQKGLAELTEHVDKLRKAAYLTYLRAAQTKRRRSLRRGFHRSPLQNSYTTDTGSHRLVVELLVVPSCPTPTKNNGAPYFAKSRILRLADAGPAWRLLVGLTSTRAWREGMLWA
jgi:hypothetical protein